MALLDESDLNITSDAVEMIVNRVWKDYTHIVLYSVFPYLPSIKAKTSFCIVLKHVTLVKTDI